MRAPTATFVIALGAGLLTGAGTAQVEATAPQQDGPIRSVLTGPVRPEAITATGLMHTCGLDDAGKAWCWGNATLGQLGNGHTSWGGNLMGPFKGTPVAVVGGHTFASLTAGEEFEPGMAFTCGLDDSGKAWCWGHGGNGKLGDGDLSDHSTGAPVAVLGGHTFTSLTAGDGHTCGLDREGKAWCWGAGYSGTPVAIGGGHTFAQP